MNKLGQVNIILSDKKHCCFTSHRAINVNRSISVIVFESFVKFNADNWKAEIVGDNNFRVEVETCGEKHVEASGLKYLGGVALIIFIIIGGEKDNGSKRHAGFLCLSWLRLPFKNKGLADSERYSKAATVFLHVASSSSERVAVRNAVAIFENRATEIIGIRDEPKMAFGRLLRKGQMDCADESIDTKQFLRVFENGRLIYFLKVENICRVVFLWMDVILIGQLLLPIMTIKMGS